jgi:hypothetical protein
MRVRLLVAEHCGVGLDAVRLETRIVEDLGCDGNDGDTLLDRYVKEFGVDLSNNNRVWFNPEGLGCLSWPFVRLRYGRLPKVTTITVGELVDLARQSRV